MENKKILILDYHLGNLFSVKQACDYVGMNAEITSDKSLIEQADGFILPGVGAFIEAMKNLESLDLIVPLKEAVASGKPILGVCLGQQLLFTESEEFGARKGLDLISGSIKRFPNETSSGNRIKVPQIGWNKVYKGPNEWEGTPLKDVQENDYMYFVHSYHVQADKKQDVLSYTVYEGIEYCSSVISGKNIIATQFHPEKSGQKGLTIYKNWALQHNLI